VALAPALLPCPVAASPRAAGTPTGGQVSLRSGRPDTGEVRQDVVAAGDLTAGAWPPADPPALPGV